MMPEYKPTFLSSRYGPRLINIRQPSSTIEIAIDGPHMRIASLELVTSLSLIEGLEMTALSAIKDDMEGMINCGHTNDEKVVINIGRNLIGPFLSLDVGPMGMYTSTMVLQTKSGVTFKELLDHQFATFAGEQGLPNDYIASFLVIPGTGEHGGGNGGTHDHHHH